MRICVYADEADDVDIVSPEDLDRLSLSFKSPACGLFAYAHTRSFLIKRLRVPGPITRKLK